MYNNLNCNQDKIKKWLNRNPWFSKNSRAWGEEGMVRIQKKSIPFFL